MKRRPTYHYALTPPTTSTNPILYAWCLYLACLCLACPVSAWPASCMFCRGCVRRTHVLRTYRRASRSWRAKRAYACLPWLCSKNTCASHIPAGFAVVASEASICVSAVVVFEEHMCFAHTGGLRGRGERSEHMHVCRPLQALVLGLLLLYVGGWLVGCLVGWLLGWLVVVE